MDITGSISITKDDANRLAIFYEVANTELPENILTKQADQYSSSLEYWVSTFLKGKKQSTGKNTFAIIQFLIDYNRQERQAKPYNRFEWVYDWVRLKEMKNGLISQGVGRPAKRQDYPLKKGKNAKKKTKPIKHYQTMLSILEGLVEAGILQKKERIDRYERSVPDKQKTNTYYRINPEVWGLPIVPAKEATKPERKRLQEKSAELHKEVDTISNGKEMKSRLQEMSEYDSKLVEASNAIVSREMLLSERQRAMDALYRYNEELNSCRWKLSQLSQDLIIAKEFLKESGMSDPDDKIKVRRGQIQKEMFAMDGVKKKSYLVGETKREGWTEDELEGWPPDPYQT